MVSLIVELSANLFDACLSVVFILLFTNCRFEDNKLSSIVTIAICFAISTAYLFISFFSVLQSILIFIVLTIYSLRLKPSRFLPQLLAPVIFELVLITVSTLCLMGYSYLFDYKLNDFISQVSTIRYLYMLSCKIIMLAILLIIVRVFSIKTSFRAIDLILYLFSPFITTIVLYTFMRIGIAYNTDSFNVFIFFSVIGLIIVNIASLFLFDESVKNTNIRHEFELYKQQKEFEQIKYTELKNTYEKITSQRHDFKKQIYAIKKYIDEGDMESVNQFIDASVSNLNEPIDYIHTNNQILDYILNAKISANPNLNFVITGEIQPINCMSELDIASLFGNMLDNAIEATYINQNQTPIELSFFVKQHHQNIICKNAIVSSVLTNNPNLKTSKKDKLIHGYGIKNMKKIVNTANGFIDFYEEDQKFCVHIVLPQLAIENQTNI